MAVDIDPTLLKVVKRAAKSHKIQQNGFVEWALCRALEIVEKTGECKTASSKDLDVAKRLAVRYLGVGDDIASRPSSATVETIAQVGAE